MFVLTTNVRYQNKGLSLLLSEVELMSICLTIANNVSITIASFIGSGINELSGVGFSSTQKELSLLLSEVELMAQFNPVHIQLFIKNYRFFYRKWN